MKVDLTNAERLHLLKRVNSDIKAETSNPPVLLGRLTKLYTLQAKLRKKT